MNIFQEPYRQIISSNEPLRTRDIAYAKQGTVLRFHEALMEKFLDRVKSDGLTKAKLCRLLGKDSGQISRLLSKPSNLTAEMIGELTLALGCEAELSLVDLEQDPRHNFSHPAVAAYVEPLAAKQTNKTQVNAKSGTNGGSGKARINIYATASADVI